MNTNHRYLHGTTPRGRRYTCAFVIAGDERAREVIYTVAVCSKRDVFTRRRGRQIASGRLDLCIHYSTMQIDNDDNFHQIVAKLRALIDHRFVAETHL